MPYTGPEPARRPLSSDDITDGIISTADLADSISINNLSNTAASGIIESNANFVDTCLVGPSVDGKAWAGKFENGSVWSSLMLASVETSGSDAEVNIWDLTDYTLTSATPLATVTLTGATPTSIAASMGYVIVGTSDQGMHIVDPHDGSWAERTDGWPYSLSSTTTPALTNDNVQFVCAGLAQQPPFDPRTGGPMPSFGVSYGAGADGYSLVKHDGNVWDRAETITSGAPISISGGQFFAVRESVADIIYKSRAPIDQITADDWSVTNLSGSQYNQPVQVDTSLDIIERFSVGADTDGLSLAYGFLFDGSLGSSDSIWANITTTYNTGYNSQGSVLTAFANSATADRSGGANTLTAGGTTTEITPYTGAEIKAYRISAGATNNTPTGDADFEMGTGSFSVCIWVYAEAGADSVAIMQYRNASTGAVPQWGINTSTTDLQAGVNDGSNSATATWTGGHTFIADGNPHLVGFSFNGTSKTVTLFVDGNEVASATNASIGNVSGGASFACGIGASPEGGNEFDNTNNWLSLARITKGSEITGDQFKKMYEAEVGMFADNAKCLLQGASDAVLDARIDPLTGKYIVTQSDTQDIFDGLAIESERTIATGGTTFEHGLLWGDGVAEINDANLYASMPATNQRQVNEMVRSMAAELPAGVDLSKAKAWCIWDMSGGSAVIQSSYNVESAVRTATGKTNIYFSVPFKHRDTTNRTHYVAVASSIASTYNCEPAGLYKDRVLVYVRNDSGSYTDPSWVSVICFGELENE